MVNPDKKTPLRLVILLTVILLVFFAAVFYSIDSKTVNSYRYYVNYHPDLSGWLEGSRIQGVK
jgi:hypothetical protein